MMRALTLPALALGTVLAGCGGTPTLDQTGPTPQLPAINQRLVPAMRIPRPAGWNGALPTVPRGFAIEPIATDLKIPRQLLVLPNGDILVAEGAGKSAPRMRPKDVIAGYIKSLGKSAVEGGDRLTLLRDANGDGRYDRTVFAEGLNAPYGLALVGGELFVANQDALVRFAYRPGMTRAEGPPVRVVRLPSHLNHHWTKSLTASADGGKLYVGIGANSNVGERGMAVEQDRAVVGEIDRASGAHRTYVSGIRNPTALAVEPSTGAIWSVANERDEIGENLVPDYLTGLRPGGFYGWPYSYWGRRVDPRVMPQRPDLVATALTPDYALGSHVAALGLAFATAPGLGQGAFVVQHGSWNRRTPSGYKVVWVPFRDGRPAGKPRDIVTGFLDGSGKARGRPVGVAWDAARGALLVADDLSNTVWRVTFAAAAPAA